MFAVLFSPCLYEPFILQNPFLLLGLKKVKRLNYLKHPSTLNDNTGNISEKDHLHLKKNIYIYINNITALQLAAAHTTYNIIKHFSP